MTAAGCTHRERRWTRLGGRSRHGGTRALFALALAFLFAWPCGPAAGREIYGLSDKELGLYAGNALLAGWRVAEARQVVDRLLAAAAPTREARELETRVLFFEGRYADALRALDQAGVRTPFRQLVAATVEASRGFRSRSSPHFQVFWSHPKDEVLADPALEALEGARTALERHLGFSSPSRVRVEIYPSLSSFTAVSTLTRREVETSGTIGLCKFDRLMIASPRATFSGYPWRDTLSHEFVHLAIYRLSRGAAPIWLHEGIARYLEGSWRGAPGTLDPAGAALLAARSEKGTLIPLDAMSPSIAKLPSAEDAALAFAQVSTMMAFLVEQKGPDTLRGLLSLLAEGRNDRDALQGAWQGSFSSFEQGWRRWVKALPLRREAVQVLGLELADKPRAEEDSSRIPDPDARDLARLGDLLRARGRPLAAAEEYAKAYTASPTAPGVASRHALGRLLRGRFAEALTVCEKGLDLYPGLGVLWSRKGQALEALARPSDAREAYRQLLEINPFDVPGRRALLATARALSDEAEVERQKRALVLLDEAHGAKGHPQ